MDWEASGSGDNGVPQTVSTPDGKPPKGKKKWPIVLAVLVILIILARISSCVSGCGSSGPSKTVDTFTWPSSGLATELPKPKTNKGEISSNSDAHFYATLQEVSHSDYDDYIKSCKDANYTDFSGEGTDCFKAKAPSGAKLSLSFDNEDKTLQITLNKAQEATNEPADTSDDSSTGSPADTSADASPTSSSDFRAMMDGYEQFMNSYVEFMKKYESSDDTASMLADYGSMMQQYSDWSQKFDSVDENSLSAEDQAYYLEVQGRVLQKLSEVQ